MIFKKPTTQEMRFHAKNIYYFIIFASVIIIPLFSYMSYFTYNITKGTDYFSYTLIILLPVIIATPSLTVLLCIGKRKFYEIYKKEEERLYQRLKRFYHIK